MKIRTPISYTDEAVLTNVIFGKVKSYTQYLWQNCLYWQWKWHVLSQSAEKVNHRKVTNGSLPILINNFNRLKSLRQQIDWLQSLPDQISIIIIDNKSSYPPLLKYYQQLTASNVQVVHLHFNSGLWGLQYVVDQLQEYPKYVITDPDLIPYPNTPDDTMQHLSKLLDKYPSYNHIGLSIEVVDIPHTYPMQERVKKWEAKFWYPQAKSLNNEVCIANVDTTFAMYRQDSKVFSFNNSLRTMRPYTLKHVDWYMNPQYPCEEYQYYLNSCRAIASWATEWKRKQEKAAQLEPMPSKLSVGMEP